jgi:TfoX/Sxy family transcriptional regulator of competence genes
VVHDAGILMGLFVTGKLMARTGDVLMRKNEAGIPADKLELYEKLVATNPKVERKGATVPYTSLNGHMFSFLTKTGTLALRLPAAEREEFLKKYKTKLCEQYGTVMKEYAEVPDAMLKKTQELKKYFDLSFAYVGSLKPTPTKKKAPKKKSQ